VIAEIALGYIAGHFLFDSFSPESIRILDFLSLLGFIFLMFLSGLEIDTEQISASLPRKKTGLTNLLKNPLITGITHFGITLILSYLSTIVLSHFIKIPAIWYFSLIIVSTSLGIILPVLKNRGEINEPYGQMLIITAAVADIFSIILFSFTAFVMKHGFKIEILYIFTLFLAFYIFSITGRRLRWLPVLRKFTQRFFHSDLQIKVKSTILIILIFVVIAQFIGEEEVLLGAFLSGLLLSGFLRKGRSLLLLKMDGIGFGFFIPVFFIMIGMRFDTSFFAKLDSSLLGVILALFFIMFAIKIIPSMLWTKQFGFKRALSGGFLVSSQLSLIIAASAIGLDLGILSEGMNAGFILLAITTCLVAPTAYNLINPKNIVEGQKILIAGGSSTGVLLTRRLHSHEKRSMIIEKNSNRFHIIRGKGLPVILGDATDENIYHELKLKPDNYVVLECGNDETNIHIARLLTEHFNHEKIIARTKSAGTINKLYFMNIKTIDERLVMAQTLESLIFSPTTYHSLIESFENYIIEEIKITDPSISGKQLKELPIPYNAILMMIKSGDELKIPHGDTYLKKGDIIHVFGTLSAMLEMRKLVE
jgi:Kef-type K+ transport system membrane component KefB